MSPSKKLRIQVRQIAGGSKLQITARERITFSCGNCNNKYYSFYFFCPQCLGRLHSNRDPRASLKIILIPEDKLEEVQQLLAALSNKEIDLAKVIHSLPWIAMKNSDPGVLEEWQKALSAQNIESEVSESEQAPRKKRNVAPLFPGNAPLPLFVSQKIDEEIRTIAARLQSAAVRMKWVEVVLSGSKILEEGYKEDPRLRILFPDFLFHIEEQLQEAADQFKRFYKRDEETFLPVIEKIQASFNEMDSEIQSVRETIDQQL